jgi:hypothetical protein
MKVVVNNEQVVGFLVCGLRQKLKFGGCGCAQYIEIFRFVTAK